MPPLTPAISDAELDVLKVLWKDGPLTVREVNTLLRKKKRRWAYNTVLTLLSRLREKGFAASDKTGVAHVFRAAVSQETLLQDRLTELAERVCDGTASPLVHALVEGKRFSKQEIKEFRELLDRVESKKTSKKRRDSK